MNSSTDYTGTVTFTSAECVLTGYPVGVTVSTPSNPTCSLTGNGAVTLTDGVVQPVGTVVTYTVSTTSTSTASLGERPSIGPTAPEMQLAKNTAPSNPHAPHTSGSGWFGAAGSAALAALFLFLTPGGARKWRQMLGVLLLMVRAPSQLPAAAAEAAAAAQDLRR